MRNIRFFNLILLNLDSTHTMSHQKNQPKLSNVALENTKFFDCKICNVKGLGYSQSNIQSHFNSAFHIHMKMFFDHSLWPGLKTLQGDKPHVYTFLDNIGTILCQMCQKICKNGSELLKHQHQTSHLKLLIERNMQHSVPVLFACDTCNVALCGHEAYFKHNQSDEHKAAVVVKQFDGCVVYADSFPAANMTTNSVNLQIVTKIDEPECQVARDPSLIKNLVEPLVDLEEKYAKSGDYLNLRDKFTRDLLTNVVDLLKSAFDNSDKCNLLLAAMIKNEQECSSSISTSAALRQALLSKLAQQCKLRQQNRRLVELAILKRLVDLLQVCGEDDVDDVVVVPKESPSQNGSNCEVGNHREKPAKSGKHLPSAYKAAQKQRSPSPSPPPPPPPKRQRSHSPRLDTKTGDLKVTRYQLKKPESASTTKPHRRSRQRSPLPEHRSPIGGKDRNQFKKTQSTRERSSRPENPESFYSDEKGRRSNSRTGLPSRPNRDLPPVRSGKTLRCESGPTFVDDRLNKLEILRQKLDGQQTISNRDDAATPSESAGKAPDLNGSPNKTSNKPQVPDLDDVASVKCATNATVTLFDKIEKFMGKDACVKFSSVLHDFRKNLPPTTVTLNWDSYRFRQDYRQKLTIALQNIVTSDQMQALYILFDMKIDTLVRRYIPRPPRSPYYDKLNRLMFSAPDETTWNFEPTDNYYRMREEIEAIEIKMGLSSQGTKNDPITL